MKYKIMASSGTFTRNFFFLCLEDGTKIPRQTEIKIKDGLRACSAVVSVVLVNDPKNELHFNGEKLFLRDVELVGARVLSYRPIVFGRAEKFKPGEIVFEVDNCEAIQSIEEPKQLEYLI